MGLSAGSLDIGVGGAELPSHSLCPQSGTEPFITGAPYLRAEGPQKIRHLPAKLPTWLLPFVSHSPLSPCPPGLENSSAGTGGSHCHPQHLALLIHGWGLLVN